MYAIDAVVLVIAFTVTTGIGIATALMPRSIMAGSFVDMEVVLATRALYGPAVVMCATNMHSAFVVALLHHEAWNWRRTISSMPTRPVLATTRARLRRMHVAHIVMSLFASTCTILMVLPLFLVPRVLPQTTISSAVASGSSRLPMSLCALAVTFHSWVRERSHGRGTTRDTRVVMWSFVRALVRAPFRGVQIHSGSRSSSSSSRSSVDKHSSDRSSCSQSTSPSIGIAREAVSPSSRMSTKLVEDTLVVHRIAVTGSFLSSAGWLLRALWNLANAQSEFERDVAVHSMSCVSTFLSCGLAHMLLAWLVSRGALRPSSVLAAVPVFGAVSISYCLIFFTHDFPASRMPPTVEFVVWMTLMASLIVTSIWVVSRDRARRAVVGMGSSSVNAVRTPMGEGSTLVVDGALQSSKPATGRDHEATLSEMSSTHVGSSNTHLRHRFPSHHGANMSSHATATSHRLKLAGDSDAEGE
jgi:heme/copper-type cytochrome/quinol oxidase subunit 4